MTYIKDGFGILRRHPIIILLFFLYQWGWTFFLYKGIQSTVVPLLQRYPGNALPEQASQLFLAEGQFQLMKTDISHSVLWTLLTIFIIRMVLTPLLNAGLYDSIYQKNKGAKAGLFKGIKRLGRPFAVIYFIQMVLSLLPVYWLVQHCIHAYRNSADYSALLWSVLPWIIVYLFYVFFIKIIFIYVQFGKASGKSWFISLKTVSFNLFPALWVSVCIALFAISITLATSTVTFLWAGVISIILHQVYQLFKTIFQIWEITSQFAIWEKKM